MDERRSKEGQLWAGAILGLLQLISIGAVLFNSEMTFGQRMSGLAAIAASLLLVAVGRLISPNFPVIRDRRKRTALLAIAGSVALLIWSWISGRLFLMGHEFPFGQWLTTLLWVYCPPLGAFLGLIWGLETGARKEVATIVSQTGDL